MATVSQTGFDGFGGCGGFGHHDGYALPPLSLNPRFLTT